MLDEKKSLKKLHKEKVYILYEKCSHSALMK